MIRRGDLDRMIDALLAGEPLPKGRLTPDEIEVLQTAIALRAGQAGADLPDAEFVAELRRRVGAVANRTEPGAAQESRRRLAADGKPADTKAAPRLPRRALLAGAAGTVAAGVVGAVAEHALSSSPSHPPVATEAEIVPEAGQWVPVALTSDVTGGQVKHFATATLVGFVTERNGSLAAVSGACTHQGCLLRHNMAFDRLDCPCHHTAFGVNGTVLFSQLPTPPATLPQIRVREMGGQIEAFLPPGS